MAFKLFLHHIDVLNSRLVTGWIVNRFLPSASPTIYFYIDGKKIDQTECNMYRQDVKDSGMHQTGYCGFEYPFPKALEADSTRKLELRINHGFTLLETIEINTIPHAIDAAKPIMFMHIPKTAGTSFNNQAKRWFGRGQWHIHIEALKKEKQVALLSCAQYLAGHLTLEKIKNLVPDIKSIDLHTIVRNPLAHVHSHLAWIKGISTSNDQKFITEHHPIIQNLSITLQQVDLSNHQTIDQFTQNLDGFEIDFFDNLQTRYFLDYRPDRVTQDDVTNAIANIALFKTIGITEQYEDYLKTWPAFYQRNYQPQKTQHNPSKVTPLFDVDNQAVQDALMPLIQYDNMLYQHILNQK